MATQIKERVINLERTLDQFIVSMNRMLYETNKAIQDLKEEMRDFKEEMREFKEESRKSRERSEKEMREFKEESRKSRERSEKEMHEFKEESRKSRERSEKEMREFKEESRKSRERSEKEMRDFKQEMRNFKEEIRTENRRYNKEMGELSNKFGTLTEDLVIPAIRPLIKRYFGEELLDISPRRNKKIKALDLQGEFDVIGVSEDKVYLVEVKYYPSKSKVKTFREETIPRFKKLFPEYKDHLLVPIFGGLYLEQKVVDYATSLDIFALAYREWDYMDILNFKALREKK
ncbi:MAG: hypothetical protein AAF849_08550 [Bacteroidota bacterium]